MSLVDSQQLKLKQKVLFSVCSFSSMPLPRVKFEIVKTEDEKRAARDNKRIVFAARQCAMMEQDLLESSLRVLGWKKNAKEGNFLFSEHLKRESDLFSFISIEIVFLDCYYGKLLHKNFSLKFRCIRKFSFNFFCNQRERRAVTAMRDSSREGKKLKFSWWSEKKIASLSTECCNIFLLHKKISENFNFFSLLLSVVAEFEF